MLRDRQEKEQLVRKFEEVLPILKNLDNFGWLIPECMADPVYHVYPDTSRPAEVAFRPFVVNVKTGWHSEVIYRDKNGTHRIPEGVTPIKDEWSDLCYRSNCVCKGR